MSTKQKAGLETPRKRNKYFPPATKGGRNGGAQKRAIFALVERGESVKTFHVTGATAAQVRDALVRNVSRQSKLYTDESRIYTSLGKEFASHDTVIHSLGELSDSCTGDLVKPRSIKQKAQAFLRWRNRNAVWALPFSLMIWAQEYFCFFISGTG